MSIKTYLAYTLFTLRLTGDESKPGEAVSVVNKKAYRKRWFIALCGREVQMNAVNHRHWAGKLRTLLILGIRI